MRRSIELTAICLSLVATLSTTDASANAAPAPPPPSSRTWRAVRAVGHAVHEFSLRHGMAVGTGLVVGGVAAGFGLYQLDHAQAAIFSTIVPPFVGLKINSVGIAARLHSSWVGAQGRWWTRMATVVHEQTDAAAVKVWSWGVKFMGLGMIGHYSGVENEHVATAGVASMSLGMALTAVGIGMHAVPRLYRRFRGTPPAE